MQRKNATSQRFVTVTLAALALFWVLMAELRAEQIQPGQWHDGRDRLSVSPGEICAEEGARLYGISPREFKTVSVQREQTGERKILVRLSIGKDWYACTLDRLHGLVDFRGG